MKNILKFLEETDSLEKALGNYISFLEGEYKKSPDLKVMERITAVRFYLKTIFDKELIAKHRDEFNELYDLMDSALPEMKFNLDGNKKSLKSFLEKLDKIQGKNESIDSVYKDIHRFRLTIQNITDNKEFIELLEKATVIIIEHFISKGYTLCKPDELKGSIDRKNDSDIKKLYSDNPEIFLPEKTSIPKEFLSRIKNYVFYPKKNGYQGIHLFFADEHGNLFEVQIRTFVMHIRSEFGPSSHLQYKSYEKKWDLSGINLPGFKVIDKVDDAGNLIEHHVLDNIGIIDPVETYVRRKTF